MTPDALAQPSDLEPTMLDTEPRLQAAVDPLPSHTRRIVAWKPTPEAGGLAGLERGAIFRGRRAARVCAPGHPGDEHRELRLAVAGVWQPDARRRVSRGSIEASGFSIISSSKRR